MTRYLAPLTAALLVTGTACAFAQTGGGAGGPSGASPGATTAPRTLSSPSPSGTSDTAAETVPPVPQPSENPNAQIPPSAATLPGGGDVPITSGSNAEEAVPIYGAQDSAGSIREAEERSRGDDCGGQGTRMASGTGTTSAQTTGRNCAENPEDENALGTMPIMGSSGTIDVRDIGR